MHQLVDTLQKNNFAALLQDRASHHPDQISYVFLIDGEAQEISATYGELDRKARAIAAHLQSIQVSGARALLIYPSGLDFIAAFFGCLYAGAIAIPAYPPRTNQNGDRLLAIAKDAQTTLALTTSSLLEKIQPSFSNLNGNAPLQWILTDRIELDTASDWVSPPSSQAELALLQYTSGATGTPKGVRISHENLLHNAASIQHCFQDSSDSVGVSWLPMHHDMGLMGGVLQPLYVGRPMILMSPTSFIQKPIRWLQAVSKHRATTSGGPNFAYDLCLQKITPEQKADLDLSSWRTAFNGAESIRAQTLEDFTEYFQDCGFSQNAFCACYGMAEATLIISGTPNATPPRVIAVDGVALEQNRVRRTEEKTTSTRQIVSCGESGPHKTIAIVDPVSLVCCPENEVGEIWVSGSGLAQGYWARPDETASTFKAQIETQIESQIGETENQTFLRTGDLGFVQANELFVTGRLKDVVIIRGRNHYPQDIEWTAQGSHPDLRTGHSAAFSVPVEGIERLVIMQEIERQALRSLSTDEVYKAIRQAVSEVFHLQVYAIVLLKPGSLPKTSSGKIQRSASRTAFLDNALETVGEWREAAVDVSQIQQSAAALLSKLQASSQNLDSGSDLGSEHSESAHLNRSSERSPEDIQLWIVANLSLYLKVPSDEIGVSEPFSNYGLDSSAAVSLADELSTWLEQDLEPTIFWEHPSIETLAHHLSSNPKAQSPLSQGDGI
jgi:acyl-CoA synthetase (AMP-forming)/AMP-acid ligase II/acyl carrier protein